MKMLNIRKIAAAIGAGALIAASFLPALAAEAVVSATVTPGVISVSVAPTSVPYGVMPLNETKISPEITATNGPVPADLNIMGADATAVAPPIWVLSAAPGSNAYTHAYSTASPSYPSTGAALTHNPATGWDDLTTGYLSLASDVAGGGTQKFELDMRTPTASAGTGVYSTTVTVQAVYAY